MKIFLRSKEHWNLIECGIHAIGGEGGQTVAQQKIHNKKD